MELENVIIVAQALFCILSFLHFCIFHVGESKLGRLVDALALGGDEGRDKLR